MKDKKFAWELFKNTGNIDAYLIMKDMEYSEQREEEMQGVPQSLGENNGINQNEGNSNQSS